MVLNAKDTKSNLLKKGFREGNGHHKFLTFYHDDKITSARTRLSHNDQDLDDYLIGQMAKQVKLSKKEFYSFAKCDITEDQYCEILRSKGIIDPEIEK